VTTGDSPKEIAHFKARGVPVAGSESPVEFQGLSAGPVAPFVPLFQIVRDKPEQSGTFSSDVGRYV